LIKDDIPRLKNSVRKNVQVTTLISLPAIVGLMAIASPFVLVTLKEQWMGSVDYIYILSAGGFFFVLYGSIGSYIIPLGKINFYFRFIFLSNVILVVIIAAGLVFNVPVKVLVAGKVLQEFFNLVYFIRYAYVHIKYTLPEILKDTAFPILISAIMGIAVYFSGFKMYPCVWSLITQAGFGAAIYILLNYLINRKMFFESFNLLKSFFRKDS
jgi:teichuronic acid exporter